MSQSGTLRNNSGGGGGGGVIINILGDTGFITGSNVTIHAGVSTQNAGSSVLFSNTGTVSTLQVTDGNSNTIIGKQSGGASLSGQSNTCLGQSSLNSLTTGSFNLVLGASSGNQYSSSESSNILLHNPGVLGESHVLRIGVDGSGNRQQNKAFVAGIVGNTVSNAEFVTIDTTTGQLGTTASGGSAFGFTAYASANLSDVTGGGVAYTILFDATTRNDGSSYDPLTGLFTAPTTGLYMFTATINQQSGSSYTAGSFFLFSAKGSAAGPLLTTLDNNVSITSGLINFSSSFALQMTAGDTVGIEILNTTALQDVSIMGSTFSGGSQQQISMFSGFRVG